MEHATRRMGVGNRWLRACLVAAAAAGLVQAKVLRVDARATGARSGASWPSAFSDFDAAIDAALPGDTVWVAKGIYRPARQLGGVGSRFRAFRLKDGVAVLGGFSGLETAAGQRNVSANQVVFNGDADSSATFSTFSYHVFRNTDIGRTTLLDGVMIVNGNAGGDDSCGAGMHNVRSSPVLRNCTFQANNAPLGRGGALYNDAGSAPLVEGCVFRQNSARQGGAVADKGAAAYVNVTVSGNSASGTYGLGGGFHNEGRITVQNATISGNTASAAQGGEGGGIYNRGTVLVHNSYVGLNTASGTVGNSGGGIASYGTLELTGSTIDSNLSSSTDGGGGGGLSLSGTSVLKDCQISRNRAMSTASFGSRGGGIFNVGKLTMERCVVSSNQAGKSLAGGVTNNTLSSYGGGIYTSGTTSLQACQVSRNRAWTSAISDYANDYGASYGGGIYADERLELVNSLVAGNGVTASTYSTGYKVTATSRAHGGGIVARDSLILLQSSVIYNGTSAGATVRTPSVNNSIAYVYESGAGIEASGKSRVENSILWGNSGNSGPFLVGLGGIRYSCVQGGNAGVGNVAVNPGFVDTAAGVYTLKASSTLIGAGDSLLALPETDLVGMPRRVGPPDMGPYEYQGETAMLKMRAVEDRYFLQGSQGVITTLDTNWIARYFQRPQGRLSWGGMRVSVAATEGGMLADSLSPTQVWLRPQPDTVGDFRLEYTVLDSGKVLAVAYSAAHVLPVNAAPDFVAGADVEVRQDAGLQVLPWAHGMGEGGRCEAGQGLGFRVTHDNWSLFTADGQPTLDSLGVLRFKPAPEGDGVALVSVRLGDDGGTDNGGRDSSAVKAFRISVHAPDTIGLTLGKDSLHVYGDSAFVPQVRTTGKELVALVSTDTNVTCVVGDSIRIRHVGKAGICATSRWADTVCSEIRVAPRPLNLTARDAFKPVGGKDPVLTFAAEGLLSGDTLEGALTRAPGELPGEYPILQGTLSAGADYGIVFVPARLRIEAPTGIASRPVEPVLPSSLSAEAVRPFATVGSASGEPFLGISGAGEDDEECLLMDLALPGQADVHVAIFDQLGTAVIVWRHSFGIRELQELSQDADGSARVRLKWNLRAANGRAVGAGVYLWKVEMRLADGRKFDVVRKMGVKTTGLPML